MEKTYNLGTLGIVDEKHFWELMPKVGECFQINRYNIWKCTQSDTKGLKFSQLVIQDFPDTGYHTINLYENMIFPSADFLHRKHEGVIVQIDEQIFDNILNIFSNSIKECDKLIEQSYLNNKQS